METKNAAEQHLLIAALYLLIVAEYRLTAAQYRLIFRTNTPSFEEVWLEGYDDFDALEHDAVNPYSATSREHQYWDDGWWASFYAEERLFNLAGQVNPSAIAEVQPKTKISSKNTTTVSLIRRFAYAAYFAFAGVFLSGVLHHYRVH